MPGYDMMFQKDRSSLPWKWAVDNLAKAHNYYLATTRSDGRPHVMPIWGIWLDHAFYFSTGKKSRKSKNLSLNGYCVICPENAANAVILEGTAKRLRKGSLREKVITTYKRKYHSDLAEYATDPIYEVRANVVFGISQNLGANPTRWRFRMSSSKK